MNHKRQHTAALDSALYASVRAAFVARGSSLNAWCLRNGEYRQNARAVLLGSRRGPAALDLRSRLLAASGVSEQRRESAK